jgi:hypothetical protein
MRIDELADRIERTAPSAGSTRVVRMRRGIERDGEVFRPHWDR